MRRRDLIAGLALAASAASHLRAQPAAKTPRIGYLSTNLALFSHLSETFRQGLRKLGYIEGRNIAIEYRNAEGMLERLPTLAAELVALKVDVIVTGAGTLAALAAKQATDVVPIVFIAVGDPVTSRLATTLARPGGNLTGLSLLFPELVGKWLELLKQAAPGSDRVAVLWQPGAVLERTEKDILTEAEAAARALGVELQWVAVQDPAEIDKALSEIILGRANAFAVVSTPMIGKERNRVVEFAGKHQLPTVFGFREYADAGGLMSYGPDLADMFRRAATYVDKILKGEKPADLPVEQPTKFELVINLKTAKALGLAVPQSILARADEIIE
jgi:putative tryptophan/tyrosine transport system substrate-binding protein